MLLSSALEQRLQTSQFSNPERKLRRQISLPLEPGGVFAGQRVCHILLDQRLVLFLQLLVECIVREHALLQSVGILRCQTTEKELTPLPSICHSSLLSVVVEGHPSLDAMPLHTPLNHPAQQEDSLPQRGLRHPSRLRQALAHRDLCTSFGKVVLREHLLVGVR